MKVFSMSPQQTILVVLLAFFAVCIAHRIDPSQDREWQQWKARCNKTYTDAAEEDRYHSNFDVNRDFVKRHQRRFQNGEVAYQVGLNCLADLHDDEMDYRLGHNQTHAEHYHQKHHHGHHHGHHHNNSTGRSGLDLTISIDWRAKGAVTTPRNQGNCGSCWAFSSVAVLESRYFLKTGKLISFSEQHLMDCSTSNKGCNGGFQGSAWDDISKLGGLNELSAYPYKEVQGPCNPKPGSYPLTYVDANTGVAYVWLNNEAELLEALKEGPVAISMWVGDKVYDDFQMYVSGIWKRPDCPSNKINHGMVAVGYDVDRSNPSSPQPYWIIKNSWGPGWGDNGYIKIAAGVNICNINQQPVSPVMTKSAETNADAPVLSGDSVQGNRYGF